MINPMNFSDKAVAPEVYFTKHSLWTMYIPQFNFEYDEDELLQKALDWGFVTKVGEDKYLMNASYEGKPEEVE
tara:strand:+ start:2793 stop:3011 length:219 start_codon:yes stop_codon:yes gene_type:complete